MTLRVKLEIVPFGDEDKAYEIGRLDIFNKGLAPPSSNGWDRGGFDQYGVLNLSPGEEGMYGEEVLHRRFEGAWQLVHNVLDDLKVTGPSSPSPKPDRQ